MRAAAFALLLALTASAASAQTDAPPQARGRGPAPRNLQVLPKDTPPQDVVALMQQFTRALGVPCTYCHVQNTPPPLTAEEAAAQMAAAPPQGGRGRGRGRGGPQMDYASDDKRQKQTARVMLTLVSDLNARIAAMPAASHRTPAERTKVECATCHRGVPNPQLLGDLLNQTMTGKGEGAAVALYRDLRQKYVGTEAYDFRENVLLDLGRQSLATAKPDDALAWLQLNVEFFPKSVESYLALSQAHERKRDQAAAAKDLEKALAIDPANVAAKRQLARLRAAIQ
jgi:hypothetical protein